MVQSVIAPDGKINIEQVVGTDMNWPFVVIIYNTIMINIIFYFQWKEISPDQLMDYKLKCVFDTPRGTNLNVSNSIVICIPFHIFPKLKLRKILAKNLAETSVFGLFIQV